uniref:Uncharacterized protein n=1 Tax=Octopus bimaculoides TaxID=37653 RepID=A0A0L8I8G0_OCTBM
MIGLRMRYHSKELIRMNQIQIYSLSEYNKIKHHTDNHDEIECEEKAYLLSWTLIKRTPT